MNKIGLAVRVLSVAVLGVLVMPVAAASEHPLVTMEGWINVRVDSRQGVCDRATSRAFITAPDRCDLPAHVYLVVREKGFWWIFGEDSINVYRNIVRLKVEPAHAFSAPSSILVIANHQKPWLIIAFGKGLHFNGQAPVRFE